MEAGRRNKRACWFLWRSCGVPTWLHPIALSWNHVSSRIASMRRTLRRSCDACARSKLSCDLRTPMCSRCVKRKMRRCVYVNEPLTLPSTEQNAVPNGTNSDSIDIPTRNTQLALFHSSSPEITIGKPLDHFNSLPQTRLPRARVLQLIHHFLSNIAFQYYPLDLEKSSNPFVVSWWPLALNDPALFHVSLQTASLDLDLKAQNGFENSEILMADSIALVRRRVEDQSLACGDETIDSVVTLAAIEFGKGNITISNMHVEGVKRMVEIRGGIHALKLASPLTARMVAWVSMVLMQHPQFDVQNDQTRGDAIAPIQAWIQVGEGHQHKLPPAFSGLELEPIMCDIITRLRSIFDMSREQPLSTTDLHDLSCFVLHQLLLLPAPPLHMTAADAQSACLRYAVALYMLVIHGPTYFTHAHLQSTLVSRLKNYINEALDHLYLHHGAIALWIVSVGLVASAGTLDGPWFLDQAKALSESLDLRTWPDIFVRLETVLWYAGMKRAEVVFQQRWEIALHAI